MVLVVQRNVLRREALKEVSVRNVQEAYEVQRNRNSEVIVKMLSKAEINKIKIPQNLDAVKGTQGFHCIKGGSDSKTIICLQVSNDTGQITHTF